jgi:cell division protein FtsX
MLLDGIAWIGASPTLLAVSGALASVALLASVWVLYRNLFTPAFDELGDARLSF